MDFEDERNVPASQESRSSSTALSLSQSTSASLNTRVSLRGTTTGGRVRRRGDASSCDKNDRRAGGREAELSVVVSTPSVKVRGAGASSWAIQDAGSMQMLNDECAFLCSALVSARSPSQALDTALELAQLLSSKKSRSILWQTCKDASTGVMVPSPVGISPMKNSGSQTQQEAKQPRRKTILDSILDVIACVSHGNTTSHPRKNGYSSSSSSLASASATGSPGKNARTKSARRKLKQHKQLVGPHDGDLSPSGNSWWSQRNIRSLPELSQILSIIVYFISLDCTLSKDHSAAAMGSTPKPALARTIRSIFINHSKALRGILQLCLHRESGKPSRSTTTTTVAKLHRIPSSVESSVSFTSSSALGSAQSNLSVDSSFRQGNKRRLLVQRKAYEVSSSLSSPENSLSSVPLSSENMATAATPKSCGDPTKAGRLKRRNRKSYVTTRDDGILDQKLPAVPEGGDLDELDWDLDTILPPPNKKRTKASTTSQNLHPATRRRRREPGSH